MQDDSARALTYVDRQGPDVKELQKQYSVTIRDLDYYFQQCRHSYDDRRNYWPGKSFDLRKNKPDAFPWKGASDQEAHVINEKVNTYIALCMNALNRSHIRAFPVEGGDMARSRVVSAFLKWMAFTLIRDFRQQMELGANYLFEKGLMVSYVGWHQEERSFLQTILLEEVAQMSPELADMIGDSNNDNDIIALLQQPYPKLSHRRGKRALAELRRTGRTELPVSKKSIARPCVDALAPDGDVFFPAWCMDIQRAPYVFYRVLMTAQEVENKVTSAGWDREWADYVIENCRGVHVDDIHGDERARTNIAEVRENDLIEVIYGYQRLIDQEDGAEGIYCTVFHPKVAEVTGVSDFAKFDLLQGFEEYPFVATRLMADQKRLYDLQTFPDLLRGTQWQVKTERDARIDRASLATIPPIMHAPGRPPSDWGPGRRIPERRPGEIRFGDIPRNDSGSLEVEQTLLKQADRLLGLDYELPNAPVRQQFYIDKFLRHVRDVLKLSYKMFQRFGPDEVFFRVTGVADPQRFTKGDAEEDFDLMVSFDSLMTDPDTMEARLAQLVSLLQIDRNGRIDTDALVEVAASATDPGLADAVIQPREESVQKITKQVTDDLTKIYSGVEVGPPQNGGQMALQVVQAWAQQPDVAESLQNNKALQARMQKYVEQIQFQLQQAQNAQIGKIGTAPAQFQGTNT